VSILALREACLRGARVGVDAVEDVDARLVARARAAWLQHLEARHASHEALPNEMLPQPVPPLEPLELPPLVMHVSGAVPSASQAPSTVALPELLHLNVVAFAAHSWSVVASVWQPAGIFCACRPRSRRKATGRRQRRPLKPIMFWTTDSLSSAISAVSRARSAQSSHIFFALPSTLTDTSASTSFSHSLQVAMSDLLVIPRETPALGGIFRGRSGVGDPIIRGNRIRHSRG
jgi:hypothetical protein